MTSITKPSLIALEAAEKYYEKHQVPCDAQWEHLPPIIQSAIDKWAAEKDMEIEQLKNDLSLLEVGKYGRNHYQERAEKAEVSCAQMREALVDLLALVQGECPRLLNEDSDGDSRLDLAISAALSTDCGKNRNCNCQERIKAALPETTAPSLGHDWVDEVLGLIRVKRMQRDAAESMVSNHIPLITALEKCAAAWDVANEPELATYYRGAVSELRIRTKGIIELTLDRCISIGTPTPLTDSEERTLTNMGLGGLVPSKFARSLEVKAMETTSLLGHKNETANTFMEQVKRAVEAEAAGAEMRSLLNEFLEIVLGNEGVQEHYCERLKDRIEKALSTDCGKGWLPGHIAERLAEELAPHVPDRHCMCHSHPPCSDCVDNGSARDALDECKEWIAKQRHVSEPLPKSTC